MESETEYCLYAVDSLLGISDPVTALITGFQEIISRSVRLYPIPVEDILYLETDQPIHSVELFNVVGIKVMEVENAGDCINLDHLEKGVYCIRIKLKEDQVITSKVIKK